MDAERSTAGGGVVCVEATEDTSLHAVAQSEAATPRSCRWGRSCTRSMRRLTRFEGGNSYALPGYGAP